MPKDKYLNEKKQIFENYNFFDFLYEKEDYTEENVLAKQSKLDELHKKIDNQVEKKIFCEEKIDRNEKCNCGSGKKYKKCCLNEDSKNFKIETCVISYEKVKKESQRF